MTSSKTIGSALGILASAALIVSASEESPSTRISVMSYNIENGGAQVDFNKTVEAIKKSGADAVGIQEAWGNTARLAKAAGWKYYDQRQHIISRFPLFEAPDSQGLYTFIEVLPGKMVAMANMHLPDEPYGPDMVRSGSTAAEVEETERKVRLPTAVPFVDKLSGLAKEGVPVFLTGDFNSPSHLDWTKPTVDVLPNHRYVVEWPVTKFIQEKGLIDSFRETHPNPEKNPIYTWPSGRPFVENSIDGFNPSKDDLPDRVDFVYTAGKSKILESLIIGEPEYKGSNIHVTPWPSDHRAVVSRFEVTPVTPPVKDLTPASARIVKQGKPEISVATDTIRSGEEITITWRNAPGNRYDYVRITPVGTKKLAWGEAIRLYTRGELNGSVKYNAENVKGNWLDWYKAEEGHWPLSPGEYDVKLMLDDGFTELAATKIKVVP